MRVSQISRRRGIVLFVPMLVVVSSVASLLGGAPAVAVVPPGVTNCNLAGPTVFTSTTVVPITSLAPAASAIFVHDMPLSVFDVDVTTKISHPFPGRLAIRVSAPDGRYVRLSLGGNGGAAADAFNGTVWDDQADPDGVAPYASNDGLVTDHPYVSGTVASPVVPQARLGLFGGAVPNGFWTLTVEDVVGGGGGGSIDGWSLSIVTMGRELATPARPETSLVGVQSIVDGGPAATSTVVIPASPGSRYGYPWQIGTRITHASPRISDNL